MRFVNIRVETIRDRANFIERIKHNTRFKKDKRVVNDQGFLNENNEIVEGFNSDYSVNKLKELNSKYDKILEEHKKLNPGFRSSRTRSFAEGILYFSEGINEDFKTNSEEFINRLKVLISDFEQEQKTEVITYQIHTDEAGNVHVHFIFKNFNATTGKALNFTRNKAQGSYLQDLAYKHYKTYGKGYNRGIKRIKKLKHLSIEEYKELQEGAKLVKKLREEKKQLQESNKQLLKQQKDLKQDISTIEEEFKVLIADIEDFAKTEDQSKKTAKWMELFKRYNDNDNIERRDKLITKVKKVHSKLSSLKI